MKEDKTNYEETYNIKYRIKRDERWRNRYREDKLKKYGNYHNPKRTHHKVYIESYRVTQLLEEIHARQKEIEAIYKKQRLTKEPP